jgi:hypothetical protein
MSKERSKKGSNAGLTKNQRMKAQRAGLQQDRLRDVVRWADEYDKKKGKPVEAVIAVKTRKRKKSTKASDIARRSVALTTLTKQLDLGQKPLSTKQIAKIEYDVPTVANSFVPLSVEDKQRIEAEILTLTSRGAKLPK